MKHMVAISHEYVNSAAAAAAYAGDAECMHLAATMGGSAHQSLDQVRVLMNLAAGGHRDLFMQTLKSRLVGVVRCCWMCICVCV